MSTRSSAPRIRRWAGRWTRCGTHRRVCRCTWRRRSRRRLTRAGTRAARCRVGCARSCPSVWPVSMASPRRCSPPQRRSGVPSRSRRSATPAAGPMTRSSTPWTCSLRVGSSGSPARRTGLRPMTSPTARCATWPRSRRAWPGAGCSIGASPRRSGSTRRAPHATTPRSSRASLATNARPAATPRQQWPSGMRATPRPGSMQIARPSMPTRPPWPSAIPRRPSSTRGSGTCARESATTPARRGPTRRRLRWPMPRCCRASRLRLLGRTFGQGTWRRPTRTSTRPLPVRVSRPGRRRASLIAP